MNTYKKILVVCPSRAVTGGPEALHQLVDHMNSLGLPAFIVYTPFDQCFEAPEPYKKYKAPSTLYEDASGNLIIFPEVNPMEAMKVKYAQAALWWLSLENFLERRHVWPLHDKIRYLKRVIKRQRPLRGARDLKKLIHFSQTEHSTQYLRSCGIEPVPLTDSINKDFLTDRYLDRQDHKKNIILYNPTKGKKVTAELIRNNPQWEFVPLRGLNPKELSEKLYSAKLYIDFGHHPGRDRMPREASMHGCCLITGILGSAGNDVDLPIPKQYKLDSALPNFLDNFKSLAADILENFDKHYRNFDEYRLWLKDEPRLFKQQIIDYFFHSSSVQSQVNLGSYKQILVACPGGAVTGGPEAMHYLVHILCNLGLKASIVYMPFEKKFEVPTAYAEFSVPVANYEDLEGNLIIFPEVVPKLVLSVKHADAAIWWLSLDNFLERRHLNIIRDQWRYFKRVIKGQRPWGGVKALKHLIHFAQSHYVGSYLKSEGVGSYPLYEPINPKFCNVELKPNISQRANEILFNPVKGKLVTDQLRAAFPEFKFTPLKDFSRDQLTEKLSTAKIYIDFGHHPGRDRFPREAAIHGCCVITGLLGSAADSVDLPIDPKYKLDQSKEDFVNHFGELVRDIFEKFEMHSDAFSEYRALIKSEPDRFREQLKKYFC